MGDETTKTMRACALVLVLLVVASCHGSTVKHPADEWSEEMAPKLACGDPCNTPDSKGKPVACRSQWGSCGNSPGHCNAKSLWTRSACTTKSSPTKTTTAKPAAAGCLTGAQVADAWVATMNALPANQMPKFHSKFTPQSFCGAALAVAHGESFDTPRCPGRLDSQASNAGGVVRGLWQFSNKLFRNGMSASQQAKVVITKYSSNDQGYGCKAPWQIKKCTAIDLPDQQNSCANDHVFCNNVWTGQREVKADHYKKFVTAHKVKTLCTVAYGKNPPTKTTTTAKPAKPAAKPACGAPCNVPDSKGKPVACRSQWGSCGNSPGHCNAKSLWTRSACTTIGKITTTAKPTKPTKPAAKPTRGGGRRGPKRGRKKRGR